MEKLRAALQPPTTGDTAGTTTSSKPTPAPASTTTTSSAKQADAPAVTTSTSPFADQTNNQSNKTATTTTTTTTAASHGPAYPTSSKKGPKDWDKIDDDDEGADDDDDDDGEKGDVNAFFRKLYKDADDDTRRAMMKSYVESNGTSLSTSWAEAKEKTYETLPPDGSEAKKW